MQLSACISAQHYVDPTLGDTPATDLKKPDNPQPIQLLFEFRTKGVANANVTTSSKPYVSDRVAKSGLFSTVSPVPVPSGRKLSIVIDNVPQADAAKRGFTTGLTFGLAGDTVTDDYVCTFTYMEPGHDPVTKEIHHAIVTTIGVTKGPEGLKPVPLHDAFTTVIKQVVDRGLENLEQASDIAQ
ncbi:hypothetical protein AAHK20_30115 [Trinickia sp. YCB016]